MKNVTLDADFKIHTVEMFQEHINNILYDLEYMIVKSSAPFHRGGKQI